jgi:cytoskeleton protein RodZ
MDEEGAAADAVENAEFRFQTVGEQLKAARTDRGLTLNEVAAQTRIPVRHLEAIEISDFAALPGSTYSLGFAKSYARFVGLDAGKIADELRTELAQGGHAGFVPATPDYEPADPSRVPPKWMAWTAAAVAIVGLIGYFLWRNYALSADPTAAVVAEQPAQPTATKAAPATPAAPPANGAVVITANDTVWMKIYGADKKRIFESEMKAGDSYTVPADADSPMIITGRPQSLAVTVGGQPVAPLGPPDRTIADVGVSAAALLARKPEEAAATQGETTERAPTR